MFGEDWMDAMDLFAQRVDRPDTVLGHDVWLGYGVTVMAGVNIGHGAIVAARSVVSSDVPPYAIAAGNPARVVRMRFSPEQIEWLLAIAWWDWPVELVSKQLRAIMATT
jgi:virginiamycin A acetyltransferase